MAAADKLVFKVKFVTSQPDLVVTAAASDCVHVLIRQVRDHLQANSEKTVRIICAGKELYPEDKVNKASSRVLHCMISDVQTQRPAAVKAVPPPPPPPAVEQPVDWLDVVDPGTVLMWIFGSILAMLWLLFIFYAHMYDRTSVVMLCMMTVAFLIPCMLSYLPWPTFLQPQARTAQHSPNAYIAGAASGRSTSVQQQHSTPWPRQPYTISEHIPPRPPAPRVRH